VKDHQPECLQCKEPMERGYVVDHGHSVVYPSAWVAGLPKWGWLLGLKVGRKSKLPITAFRCPRCGRLDSYAWPGEWRA
jgi:hypothetical protein